MKRGLDQSDAEEPSLKIQKTFENNLFQASLPETPKKVSHPVFTFPETLKQASHPVFTFPETPKKVSRSAFTEQTPWLSPFKFNFSGMPLKYPEVTVTEPADPSSQNPLPTFPVTDKKINEMKDYTIQLYMKTISDLRKENFNLHNEIFVLTEKKSKNLFDYVSDDDSSDNDDVPNKEDCIKKMMRCIHARNIKLLDSFYLDKKKNHKCIQVSMVDNILRVDWCEQDVCVCHKYS